MAASPFQVPVTPYTGTQFGGNQINAGNQESSYIMPGVGTVQVGSSNPTSGYTGPSTTDSSQNSQSNSSPATPPSTNLQPGSSGPDVQAMQNYLAQMGYLTPSQVNSSGGQYDSTTTAAVAKMQQDLGVNAGNDSGDYGPQTQKAIASKYQNVFQSVQGTEAPNSQGAAAQVINQQTQPSTDPVFNAMSSTMGPILQSLGQVLQNINNPALTAVSLQSEYNTLQQQYGLPNMQASLLNMQNIMTGTDQDVRDEITKSGGFATDSQVSGITSARNTVILKQYNALATQYQAAQTNVSNMMQYASTDQQTELQRQSASASITESLASIESQMYSMGQTMQQNAQANYQKTLTGLGGNYQAFASTISPSMQPYVESVMGLQPGTLSDPQELSLLSNASLKYQQLQIQQQRSLIYGYNAGYPAPSTGADPTSTINSIFGASNPVGAYATDPNYVSEISSLYSTVSGLGVANDPAKLQQYIQNNAPNSPVTGQMITQAAQQTGVDPALLTTVLAHESNFGTAGAGAKTDNPGNQGNTGTSTQSFSNWYSGVLATAQNLSNRQQAVGITAPQANYTSAPVTPYAGATPASNISPFSQNNPVNAASSQGSYTVQSGDGLKAIASKFGITSDSGIQAIAKINGIQDVNQIKVGQTLTMPVAVSLKSNPSSTGYISPADFDSSKYTQIGGTPITAPPTKIQTDYNSAVAQVQTAQATPVTGSPLNKGRLTRNANSALKSYLASPIYTAVSSGATYLSRINAAMQDPGSISDTSLADSIIKIETGGGQVTEAQLDTYFKGQSFSDAFNVQKDKVEAKGGVLSPQQRTDLDNLAKDVFSNYQTQYEQLYTQAAQNLQGQGIPLNYMGNFPNFLSLIQTGPTQ